jgi:hypothetical protein
MLSGDLAFHLDACSRNSESEEQSPSSLSSSSSLDLSRGPEKQSLSQRAARKLLKNKGAGIFGSMAGSGTLSTANEEEEDNAEKIIRMAGTSANW